MKQNKKTINEAQLRAIISEAVKKVLKELDARTYQWASDQRQLRNQDVVANGENSPYAEKYKQMGKGNLINGIIKGAESKDRLQQSADDAWAQRSSHSAEAAAQATQDRTNFENGQQMYLKGNGWRNPNPNAYYPQDPRYRRPQ